MKNLPYAAAVMILMIVSASAVRPGQHPKNLAPAYATTTTLPNRIILYQDRIDGLLNECYRRCAGKAGAYQAGCADTCDWILSYTGIKQVKFSSAPNIGGILQQASTLCLVKTSSGYWGLPGAGYILEYHQDDRQLNISLEGRPYPVLGVNQTLNYYVGEWRIWPKKKTK